MQGRVNDGVGRPILSASVYLLKAADSTLVKFAATDKTGSFIFSSVKPGVYVIRITAVGYMYRVTPKIVFGNMSSLDIGTVYLQKNSMGLQGIAVIGKRDLIEIKADKTTINIRNSDLMVGNNALEVLGRSPGVQVDNNDDISLYGRPDVLVMIDNKPTYLSGIALSDMLRGIQSSMIDKIELISNPNSTYDAAGTGGVINIRMIKDKTVGANLQLTAGFGVAQFPGGVYSGYKDNAGINFNYRTKRLNIFGGYSYANSPAYRSINTDRLDSYLGNTDIIDVDLFIDQRRETGNYRIGADYDITTKQTIGFLITDVYTKQTGPKNTRSVISNNIGGQNVVDSTILTSSMLSRQQSNLGFNLNYTANMGKKGSVALNADHIRYTRSYNEQFQSNYYYSYNAAPYKNLVLQNNSPLKYNAFIFSGNYHVDISGDSFIAGFKASKTQMDNNSDFTSLKAGAYVPYAGFSGEFQYVEKLGAVYIDYNHVFNKSTNIEVGARLEQTISESRTLNSKVNDSYPNNYFGFFPNIKLNHIINANNQWQLGYGRRVYRPKYEDLNPLVLFNDQYTYQIGNQYLKPYYSNLIEFKHIYKDKFITTVSFEAISGFAQVVYQQSDTTQISRLTKINLGNRYNYTLNFLAPLTLSKWYGVDISLDLKYQRFTATSTMGDLNNGSPDITIRVTQHFKLPWHMRADLGAYYETPTTFGIYRYQEEYYAYGSISKTILKKGSLHLNVDGMFNTDKAILTSRYQNLNLNSTQIDKFRTITLSFFYPLGSQTIKASRKKDSETDEEQNRINQ